MLNNTLLFDTREKQKISLYSYLAHLHDRVMESPLNINFFPGKFSQITHRDYGFTAFPFDFTFKEMAYLLYRSSSALLKLRDIPKIDGVDSVEDIICRLNSGSAFIRLARKAVDKIGSACAEDLKLIYLGLGGFIQLGTNGDRELTSKIGKIQKKLTEKADQLLLGDIIPILSVASDMYERGFLDEKPFRHFVQKSIPDLLPQKIDYMSPELIFDGLSVFATLLEKKLIQSNPELVNGIYVLAEATTHRLEQLFQRSAKYGRLPADTVENILSKYAELKVSIRPGTDLHFAIWRNVDRGFLQEIKFAP